MSISISPPRGIVCTEEEYTRSITDPSIFCLTRPQSLGLLVVSQSGLISLFATFYVFSIIARNTIRHVKFARQGRWRIVKDPMDIFMLSLFAADFVQALGAVMDFKWVQDGKVEIGGFCTAQGVVQQLGETGVAMTTLVITIFTFAGIWWRKGVSSLWVARTVIALVWIFIILMVAIGNGKHTDKKELYQSPTPFWCWIGQDYLGFRIWGEYIWFWITLGFSLVLYSLLFFWSRGNITINETSWWRFSVHRSRGYEDGTADRYQSLAMIVYPVVYCILILPLSVVRWIGFVQERGGHKSHISSGATLTVIAIYGLSGAFNVLLLLTTRPDSILFGHRITYDSGHAPSLTALPISSSTAGQASLPETHDVKSDGHELGRLHSRSLVDGWQPNQ